MAQFLTRTSMDVWGDGAWVLLEPLRFESDIIGEIEAPAGFITDLASIPRLFRRVIPVNGRHRYAAIIHDWLYANAPAWDRKQADDVFLEAMKVLGVPGWKQAAMYRAVRIGGGIYWNRRNGLTPDDMTDPNYRPLSLINVGAA